MVRISFHSLNSSARSEPVTFESFVQSNMGTCRGCGVTSPLIAHWLGYCVNCIRKDFKKFYPEIEAFHQKTRFEFDLLKVAPQSPLGKRCGLCINDCRLEDGETGFCGVRKNDAGKVNQNWAWLDWYYDPLPTNCVADWVCGANSLPALGYKNLAVFYQSCSFNCLGCQNWHFKTAIRHKVTAEELIAVADEKTACICFFGGDPAPNVLHALKVSRALTKLNKRICWETNGSSNPKIIDQMVKWSLVSGGCVKIDLKAFSEKVHLALAGVSNKWTLENIERVAKKMGERPLPPLLIVSTLLVPGYIDEEEITGIAKFLAKINKNIPWALLAFYPHFYLKDLPTTSQGHAEAALEIAKNAGLANVRLGNVHLLSSSY